MNKDLIVTILTPTTDEDGQSRDGTWGEIGTGYPVGEDLILTARHVVAPERRDPKYPILVRWYYFAKDLKPDEGWLSCPHGQERSEDAVVWVGKGKLDAALLRCPRPAEAKVKGWGSVADKTPFGGDRWDSTRFPSAARCEEGRKPCEFSGHVEGMADLADHFEIDAGTPPEMDGLWKGASGMPVFVHGEILGVVASIAPDFNAKKLIVTPAWKLLRDEDFCAELGYDPYRELLERIIRVMVQELEDCPAAARSLAEVLHQPCIDAKTCCGQLAQFLATTPLEQMFHAAEEARERLRKDADTDAIKAIANLVQAVLPVVFDHRVIEDVRLHRTDLGTALIALPAALHSIAEIVMAGVDRRPTQFRPLEPGDDFPRGAPSLPLPPEPGRDLEGDQFKRDWQDHLLNLFEAELPDEFSPAFDAYMTQRFTGRDFRARRPPPDILVEYVRNKLRDEAERKHLTYYFIAPMPADERAHERRRGIIQGLKQKYPHVVFIELSNDWDRYLQEQQRYQTLPDLLC